MATAILMPKMGATMEMGTIIQWLKNEGDRVEEGEPLLEIMTDKITMEVESTVSGVLLKILYEPQTEVPVMEPIAYVGEPGETIPQKPDTQELRGAVSDSGQTEETGAHSSFQRLSDDSVYDAFPDQAEKPRRTPAARKLAERYGIDLRNVQGTGPNNRIQKADVELYLKNRQKITPLAEKVAETHQVDVANLTGSGPRHKVLKQDVQRRWADLPGTTVKYEGIRKTVGERMSQSAFTAPHVTLTTEIDMSQVMEIRKRLLPLIEQRTGFRLSYTEVIVKAVAHTLKRHPMLNASLDGDTIRIFSDISIGLAVAIPNGLIVPVIKHADQKGLADLTAECKRLAKAARENRLTLEDMMGSTFTVSNLGMYAVDAFTPVINPPEAAILGVGRIQEKAVGVNGSIVLRPMMTLSLSFDHRVIDGAPAAAFLTDLKNVLENPYEMMI